MWSEGYLVNIELLEGALEDLEVVDGVGLCLGGILHPLQGDGAWGGRGNKRFIIA